MKAAWIGILVTFLALSSPAWAPGSIASAQYDPPTVDLWPSDGDAFDGYEQTFDVSVGIEVFDDFEIDGNSLRVTLSQATYVGAPFVLSLESDGTSGTAQATIRIPAGTSTVTVRVCDTMELCTTVSASYTYVQLPPAPPSYPFSMSVPQNDSRNLACSGCMYALESYSTPVYRSLDTERSVRLFYSSAQAHPQGRVTVFATDPEDGLRVDYYFIEAQYLNGPRSGTLVTLSNGQTRAYFKAMTGGITRLTAQFDAATSSELPTGSYNLAITVGRTYTDGHAETRTANARALIINERASLYGAGWSVAGIQQVRAALDGSGVVVTDGAGSIAFFEGADAPGSRFTSPIGDFSVLERRSADSGQVRYERRYPDGSITRFSTSGLAIHDDDRHGNRVSYQWTTPAQLHSVTDPAGKTLTLAYRQVADTGGGWALGTLRAVTSPNGRVSTFGVDNANDLRSIVDPDGAPHSGNSYDAQHRLTQRQDRYGATWDYVFDAVGGLLKVYSPAIDTSESGGSGLVRPVTQVLSLERAVSPSTGQGTSSTNLFWGAGAQVRVVQVPPMGDTLQMVLNSSDRVVLTSNIDQTSTGYNSTFISYNPLGQVISTSDGNGGAREYTWSGSRLIRESGGTGGIIDYYYTTQGLPLRVYKDDRLIRTYFYSAITSFRSPDSILVDTSVTRFTYDARGRVKTIDDPQQHRVEYVYEPDGWQNTKSVTTDQRTTTFHYDNVGRVERITDPANRSTSTSYDAINRQITRVGPALDTTRYEYDDANRIYTVRDAKGQQYTEVRNAAAWTTQIVDPRGQAEVMTYDLAGNVKKYINRRGAEVRLSYDVRNRVTARIADGITTSYSYDLGSLWVAATTGASTDTIFLDTVYIGRTKKEVSVRGGVRYEIGSRYKPNGLRDQFYVRSGVSAADPDSRWGPRILSFGYDTLYRETSVFDFGGSVGHITYNADQLQNSFVLSTGLTVNYGYSATHAMSSIEYTNGLDGVLGRRYDSDIIDRLKWAIRGSPSDYVLRETHYDSGGRLATYSDTRVQNLTGQLLREYTYTYDAVGNRTDNAASPAELGNRVESFGGFTFTYDADGNVTRKFKSGVLDQSFEWNSLSQLTSVVTNGSTTTFKYDGFGRRIRQTSPTADVQYLFDGSQLIMELTSTGYPLREYSYHPGGDRPHALRRASDGAVFYYASEQPGNIVALLNSSNQVVNTYEYTPFGQTIASSEAVPQPFRFTGREYDAETGLYYHHARYYDPQLGRFLSEDPSGLAGGINRYVYAGNDPVNKLDPTGTTCVEWIEYVRDGSGRIVRIVDFYYADDESGVECNPFADPYDPNYVDERRREPKELPAGHERRQLIAPSCPVFSHEPVMTALAEDYVGQMAGARLRGSGDRATQVRLWGHATFPGPVNSMARHAAASYVLTKEYGATRVRAFGVINEVMGFIRNDVERLPARLSGRSAWAFEVTDLIENEIGIHAARNASRNVCRK